MSSKKDVLYHLTQQYELYPLHRILLQLGRGVINSLSATHSLTGCNTVVKVGTKGSMLKALNEHSNLLENFATDRLDKDNIQSAEKFLLKVIESKKLSGCPTFNDFRLKLYRQSMVKKYVDLPAALYFLGIERTYLKGIFKDTALD